MKVKYTASVMVPAGWRSVEITAIVQPNKTGKMGIVQDVLAIDGETVKPNMSRTGANRQKYCGTSIAYREIGKNKRLSACEIVSE